MSAPVIPRALAMAAAGREFADARAERDAKTPEQAAADAYVPGGPSVDELTKRILAAREAAAAARPAA